MIIIYNVEECRVVSGTVQLYVGDRDPNTDLTGSRKRLTDNLRIGPPDALDRRGEHRRLGQVGVA